jgi:hypothetical protein
VVVATFLLVGGVIAPHARDQLGDPGQVGVLIGTVVQLLTLAVAWSSAWPRSGRPIKTGAGRK